MVADDDLGVCKIQLSRCFSGLAVVGTFVHCANVHHGVI